MKDDVVRAFVLGAVGAVGYKVGERLYELFAHGWTYEPPPKNAEGKADDDESDKGA